MTECFCLLPVCVLFCFFLNFVNIASLFLFSTFNREVVLYYHKILTFGQKAGKPYTCRYFPFKPWYFDNTFWKDSNKYFHSMEKSRRENVWFFSSSCQHENLFLSFFISLPSLMTFLSLPVSKSWQLVRIRRDLHDQSDNFQTTLWLKVGLGSLFIQITSIKDHMGNMEECLL